MKNLTDRDRQAFELAGEILDLARNSIFVNLRFMDRALGNFKMLQDMNYSFASTSGCVIYSPWTMILNYQKDQNLVTRDLLHAMLHSIFRHSYVGADIDRQRWDLACDIAVENTINSLGKDFLRANRQTRQADALSEIAGAVTYLTAERIYSYLLSGSVSWTKMSDWAEIFRGDQHDLWYGAGSAGPEITSDADLEELWKEISRRMQTELELMQGDDSALTQNLRDINRVRYNYTEFLRRFAAKRETIRLSEEEFDINYYTYGMDLYGDMPLIEPLEYKDSKEICDLVIAIDTSGSVHGEVVQKFVQHTHDILSESESLSSRMNLYLIQCDDRIRDVRLIRSREDFMDYFRDTGIKGLGRTDFRPVFDYVKGLLDEDKLTDLRGLLYFTDGEGRFPDKAPGYDTAFIIHNDSLDDVWVPDWAMKIEMQTEEILGL